MLEALAYRNAILLIIVNINLLLEIVIVFLSVILYLYKNKNFSYFDQDKPNRDVGYDLIICAFCDMEIVFQI